MIIMLLYENKYFVEKIEIRKNMLKDLTVSLSWLILFLFTTFLVSAFANLYWVEESPCFFRTSFLLLIAFWVSFCIQDGAGDFTDGVTFSAVSRILFIYRIRKFFNISRKNINEW